MAEDQEVAAEGSADVGEGESPGWMSDEDYMATQVVLGNLAGFVLPLDLEGFLFRLGMAESVGPVLDPTLYNQAAGKMDHLRRLARAAREFQKVVEEVSEEVGVPEEEV